MASSAVGDGRQTVTTAGTRVQLAASTPCISVCVTALAANTDKVVCGGPTVVAAAATRRGTPLAAGESVTYTVGDLRLVYLDAVVSGEGVSYSYEVA